MTESLLDGFRALDLADEKGFVCGQILATMGVEVIKIEKPGGDASRNIPPFYQNIPDPERSLYWFAFNTDKKSITINLETKDGQEIFKKLAIKSDFVIESFTPGYMDNLGIGYEVLSRNNPRLIMTSITHFGQKGPYRHYKGSELIDSAMSGVLDNTGQSDRPPVKEGLDALYFHAGANAALGTLIAHYYRGITGEGQYVDVSIQHVATTRASLALLPWMWDKRLVKRQGTMGQTGFRPFPWIWTCKDGYVFWFFLGGPTGAPANRALSQWINEDNIENALSQVNRWEELDMTALSDETLNAFRETINQFFLRHTKKELAEEGLRRGTNTIIASNPADVRENVQYAARNYWKEVDHPELGTRITYPRHFFICSETENYVRHKAPGIGQNNKEIYGKELGFSSSEIAAFKEAGVI